jgi:Holliday junction resolvase RusA-like endonuclease
VRRLVELPALRGAERDGALELRGLRVSEADGVDAVITFYVRGDPKPQPRQRSFVVRGPGGKPVMVNGQPMVRAYDPGSAEGWKSLIATAAAPHRPPEPLEGPLCVSMDFWFRRPKYLITRASPDGVIPHTAKPDCDNCSKAVLDALTVLGFWNDDNCVYTLVVEKFYAPKGNSFTGVKVEIVGPELEAGYVRVAKPARPKKAPETEAMF